MATTTINHLLRRGLIALVAAMAVAAIAAAQASYAPASDTTATDTLKQPPFAPTNTSLLAPFLYGGPGASPPTSGPSDEATLRQQLGDLLEQRFPNNPKTVRHALALFDSSETKQKVSDPRLRAAVVGLKGTAGEPGMQGLLNGAFSTVRFVTESDIIAAFGSSDCGCIAAVVPYSDGHLEVWVPDTLQYEDFRQHIPAMAHEALHRSFEDGVADPRHEELIANSVDALIYGQLLLENPELATSGTEIAVSNNTKLMARLNTRDSEGNLRLLASTGNIFPNSNSYVPHFAVVFEPLGEPTRGSRVLTREVKNVVGRHVTLPKRVNFNDKTVKRLDRRQALLTDAQIVKLAKILKLDTSPPSSTVQAQRVQEETEASEQPVPDWRKIFGKL